MNLRYITTVSWNTLSYQRPCNYYTRPSPKYKAVHVNDEATVSNPLHFQGPSLFIAFNLREVEGKGEKIKALLERKDAELAKKKKKIASHIGIV